VTRQFHSSNWISLNENKCGTCVSFGGKGKWEKFLAKRRMAWRTPQREHFIHSRSDNNGIQSQRSSKAISCKFPLIPSLSFPTPCSSFILYLCVKFWPFWGKWCWFSLLMALSFTVFLMLFHTLCAFLVFLGVFQLVIVVVVFYGCGFVHNIIYSKKSQTKHIWAILIFGSVVLLLVVKFLGHLLQWWPIVLFQKCVGFSFICWPILDVETIHMQEVLEYYDLFVKS